MEVPPIPPEWREGRCQHVEQAICESDLMQHVRRPGQHSCDASVARDVMRGTLQAYPLESADLNDPESLVWLYYVFVRLCV